MDNMTSKDNERAAKIGRNILKSSEIFKESWNGIVFTMSKRERGGE